MTSASAPSDVLALPPWRDTALAVADRVESLLREMTLEEVRASGRYRYLTPDQLIAEVGDATDYGPIVLHPLVGGMPVDEAWKSVQLLVDKVVPALA